MSKALGKLAVDTNAGIGYLHDEPLAIQWMEAAQALCFPVICIGELEYGALHSSKPNENLHQVIALVKMGEAFDVDRGTAHQYAEIRQALAAKGTPIPEADLWIAAICLKNNVPLLSSDGHFDLVQGLTRYDWTQPLST